MNYSFQPVHLLHGVMAAVFLYHGLTKDLTGFANSFGFALPIAALVIFGEVAGGLGYLAGSFYEQPIYGYNLIQWSSLAVIPILIGAIYLVHGKNGFNVMNSGFEYQLTLLAIAVYLFITN